MVTVAPRVSEYWRELETRFAEPAIVLVFVSRLSRRDALRAVERAVGRAIERLENQQTGVLRDEFRTGHWAITAAPDGILLRIDEEPTDFEGLLQNIVDGLETLGVEGELDLYQPEERVALPETVDLLECRLRLRGTRYHMRGRNYGWRVDPAALSAVMQTALNWCREKGASLPVSLIVGLMPPVTVRADDDLGRYIREAFRQISDVGVMRVTSAVPNRFRTVAVDVSRGRLSLIEGGAVIARDGWRLSLRKLSEMMLTVSEEVVYGFIKRGMLRESAELATSLADDWPPIPHFNALAMDHEAFENEFVPDVFCVQLLGPGHKARFHSGKDWRVSNAGRSRLLVEHVDQEAWYGAPFAPQAVNTRSTSGVTRVPEVLSRARRELATLLFTDDVPVARQ